MTRKQRARSSRDPEFSRESGEKALIGKPTWIVFGFLILALAVAFSLRGLPQYQKLQAIEAELADAKNEEVSLLKKKRQYEAEAEALRKNPGYLEARARDPLRYYREGETVIQLER